MPPTTPYPRSVLKRTAKAHTGLNIGKNVDIQMYLQYKLFMQESFTLALSTVRILSDAL